MSSPATSPSTLQFDGPIFIVGMPRSGTKLLRDLLNNHSRVAIPTIESNVIPYFYRRREHFGDLSQRKNFSLFSAEFGATYFVRRMKEEGFDPSDNKWFSEMREPSLSGALETYFRLYAANQGKNVWGDKSPPYMLHLPLLKLMFPQARFIHIVRDVRDHCVSIRKAWGKNIIRAAQRWADDIKDCLSTVNRHELGDRYMLVYYEELISDPAQCMADVCAFLSLEFELGMERLVRPAENLGDTRGTTQVVRTNLGKWRVSLSPREIERIEAVALPAMAQLGYVVGDAPNMRRKRIGRLKMLAYKGADALNLFRAYRREHGGTSNALHFMFKSYRQRATRH